MEDAICTIKLSACISAQDGVISNRELDKCFELVSDHFEGVNKEIFDEVIDAFFDENLDLEDYLENKIRYDLDDEGIDGLNHFINLCYQAGVISKKKVIRFI